jgi:hypothetical protein
MGGVAVIMALVGAQLTSLTIAPPVGGPDPAVGVGPYRHEARRLDPGRSPKLAPPRRKQPTYHAVAPATSEMLAPSSKLSATIRAFASAVHSRRRAVTSVLNFT